MKRTEKFYLLVLLLVAFFLRAYKISDNFIFSGEFGTELLYVRDSLFSGRLPLIGLPTSHTWISYGPLYYWLMMPLVKFFGFEPLLGAWVGIVVGTSAVPINYFFIKKIFNDKIALISSAAVAISPIWIWFSKMARLYIFTWIIFYPFLFFLWELWKGKVKNIFWLGLTWGLFFNFHFSPILLIPALGLALFLKRKILKVKHYLMIGVGAVLANLPALIYDSQRGFSMLRSFALWIPYRIAGFLGFYPKNNPTSESLSGSLAVINEFFGKILIGPENFWILGTIIFVVSAIYFVKKFPNRILRDFGLFIIILSTLSVLVGVFVHGAPPIHYFLPLFPIPPLLFGILVERFWNKRTFKVVMAIAFFLIFIVNYKFFFKATLTPDFVPYKLQREIAEFIAIDANGESFKLRRVGPYDHFSENYSQNYRYLLWLFGNEPVGSGKITYTIYEDTTKLPVKGRVSWFSKIAVLKEDK